jgi:hypothetical protein
MTHCPGVAVVRTCPFRPRSCGSTRMTRVMAMQRAAEPGCWCWPKRRPRLRRRSRLAIHFPVIPARMGNSGSATDDRHRSPPPNPRGQTRHLMPAWATEELMTPPRYAESKRRTSTPATQSLATGSPEVTLRISMRPASDGAYLRRPYAARAGPDAGRRRLTRHRRLRGRTQDTAAWENRLERDWWPSLRARYADPPTVHRPRGRRTSARLS